MKLRLLLSFVVVIFQTATGQTTVEHFPNCNLCRAASLNAQSHCICGSNCECGPCLTGTLADQLLRFPYSNIQTKTCTDQQIDCELACPKGVDDASSQSLVSPSQQASAVPSLTPASHTPQVSTIPTVSSVSPTPPVTTAIEHQTNVPTTNVPTHEIQTEIPQNNPPTPTSSSHSPASSNQDRSAANLRGSRNNSPSGSKAEAGSGIASAPPESNEKQLEGKQMIFEENYEVWHLAIIIGIASILVITFCVILQWWRTTLTKLKDEERRAADVEFYDRNYTAIQHANEIQREAEETYDQKIQRKQLGYHPKKVVKNKNNNRHQSPFHSRPLNLPSSILIPYDSRTSVEL